MHCNSSPSVSRQIDGCYMEDIPKVCLGRRKRQKCYFLMSHEHLSSKSRAGGLPKAKDGSLQSREFPNFTLKTVNVVRYTTCVEK